MALRQFVAGKKENRGRAAALKAIAYVTASEMTDTRNNRHYDYTKNNDPDRVLFADLYLPTNAPAWMRRENFGSLAEQQQAVWSSLAEHEESVHGKHKGANQYAPAGKPIISRADVVILDKRLFIDEEGHARKDGTRLANQILTDFVREEYTRKGLIAAYAIHDQTDGNGNFHAHIVSSYRKLTPDGWGQRLRGYGKAAWTAYTAGKYKKFSTLQQRKLESLGVSSKNAQGKMVTGSPIDRRPGVTNPLPVKSSAPLPDGKATSAGIPQWILARQNTTTATPPSGGAVQMRGAQTQHAEELPCTAKQLDSFDPVLDRLLRNISGLQDRLDFLKGQRPKADEGEILRTWNALKAARAELEREQRARKEKESERAKGRDTRGYGKKPVSPSMG